MDVSNKNVCRDAAFACAASALAALATSGWLTPRQAFAEARGIVSLIKDSAATSPIVTHKLRNNVSVLEGSGGNVAVLTGPDGKVLIDAGIGVSRPQMTKALMRSAPIPITHLVNTHWHFDHTDGNTWLHDGGREDHRAGKHAQISAPKFSGSTTGTTISCRCRQAAFPARSLPRSTI